jgi:hypothetical protein
MVMITTNSPAGQPASLVRLLAQIERFLKQEKMAPTRFGILACNDHGVVGRLRAGKGLNASTVDKLRAFMAANRKRKA